MLDDGVFVFFRFDVLRSLGVWGNGKRHLIDPPNEGLHARRLQTISPLSRVPAKVIPQFPKRLPNSPIQSRQLPHTTSSAARPHTASGSWSWTCVKMLARPWWIGCGCSSPCADLQSPNKVGPVPARFKMILYVLAPGLCLCLTRLRGASPVIA